MREHFDVIIEGRDGFEVIYSRRVPSGCLPGKQLEATLQRLACHFLSLDEIVDSSLKRRSRGRRVLLEVQKGKDKYGRGTLSVGDNPYFIARSGKTQND